MDIEKIFVALGNLGPALGSVIILGIILWKHMDVFKEINKTLKIFNKTLCDLQKDVNANTKVTRALQNDIKRKKL